MGRGGAVLRYALYALLIFTPLARGSVQGWAMSIINLVTLIALTVLLLEKTLTWEWQWIKTPLDKPIICLLVLCLLSSIFSLHKNASLWAFILLLNYITIYYLVIYTVNTRSQLRQLIYVIVGLATFLAIFGLIKKFGNNPFPWWDYEYNRNIVTGTYGNPNHFAGYMEMAIPLILGLLLTGFRGGKLVLLLYLVPITVIALILSLSRGGWIGTTIGLAFMGVALLGNRYFRRKKLVLAFIGASFFIALIVPANRSVVLEIRTLTERGGEHPLQDRVLIWAKVLNMASDHPLLGTGPGTFSTIFTQYQPPGHTLRYTMAHNDYLHFISEVGIALVAILIWMIIAFYRKGFEKLKNPSRLVRGTTLGAMSGVTAILIHSIFDFNLHIPANAILFTVLTAIVVSPIPNPAKPEL